MGSINRELKTEKKNKEKCYKWVLLMDLSDSLDGYQEDRNARNQHQCEKNEECF